MYQFTEVPLAQTQGDNFLGVPLAIDTHFLAVCRVELSPLQGRVEEILPDTNTEGVDLICTSYRQLVA